jgi:hypothetical protein
MLWIGYRRVLYLPSDKGLGMGDFWKWEFAPEIDPKDYNEHTYFVEIRRKNVTL